MALEIEIPRYVYISQTGYVHPILGSSTIHPPALLHANSRVLKTSISAFRTAASCLLLQPNKDVVLRRKQAFSPESTQAIVDITLSGEISVQNLRLP